MNIIKPIAQNLTAHTPANQQGSNTMLSTFPFAKCCNITQLQLQMFAEGGAGTGAAAAGAGDAVGSAPATGSAAATAQASTGQADVTSKSAGEQLSRAARRQARASGEKQSEKNPLSAVQYGKEVVSGQDAAATKGTATPTRAGGKAMSNKCDAASADAVDKTAAFEELIRGEYKEQFAIRTQNLINQRFKETKQLAAKSQKAEALVSRLAQRYGVNASDMDAIVKAAEADESYTEKEANSRGLSVEEMRRVKQLESENAQLRSAEKARNTSESARKLYLGWMKDGESVKAKYPNFDFKTELANTAFTRMIRSGVPLLKAYESTHLDEILGGAMQYTADQVSKGMAARIADRANRPAENGTTPHAGAVVKPDVAGLSRSDREEIERRVMRGEKILF